MAINFPGPLIAELFYEVEGLTHKNTVSLAHTGTPTPGLSADQYDVDLKGGGTNDLASFLDSYAAVFAPLVPDTAVLVRFDVWWSDQTSFDRIFITSHPLGLGGSGGGIQEAVQATFSFRSAEGGIAKIAVMDCAGASGNINLYRAYPTGSAESNAMFDFVVADTSAILARDTSYLVAPSFISKGQNEKLWRQRFR